MFTIIELTILTALFVNGLQIATSENMLLNFIKVWLDKVFLIRMELIESPNPDYGKADIEPKLILEQKHIYRKIYYPILYCVKCMPSIYGTILAFIFLPVTPAMIYQIPIVWFCSAALSTVLWYAYNKD